MCSVCIVREKKGEMCSHLEDKNLHSDIVVLHTLYKAEHACIIAHQGIEASLHEGEERGGETGVGGSSMTGYHCPHYCRSLGVCVDASPCG